MRRPDEPSGIPRACQPLRPKIARIEVPWNEPDLSKSQSKQLVPERRGAAGAH